MSNLAEIPCTEQSLEAQIAKIAACDKAALAELYTQSKAAVYGFALSILRNKQDAEDVLQETYISIFSASRGYQAMGKPMAWILTITRNCALMKLRQRSKISEISDDFMAGLEAESASLSGEDKLLLRAALSKLRPQDSQVIILHAVAGFKHREIAEVLGLPLSTVLSKYNRGLKKLEAIMNGDEDNA